MYQYILFDLDGTLTDPKEGITKSVQYALKHFEIDEPDLDKLEPFIGPPLIDSFREFYGIDGADSAVAVAKYRERFSVQGIHENMLYPGMDRMLRGLKERGCMLAIASSKPQEFVQTILQNFGIADYFCVVVGSGMDGSLSTKDEVLEEALARLRKKAGRRYKDSNTLMVGDRKFDMEAAHKFGIDSAAVTYGYAPEGELALCGPTYMADSVEELEEIITGEKSYMKYRQKNVFSKTFEILLPLFLYWVVQLIVYNGLYVAAGRYAPGIFAQKQQLSVGLNAAAAIASWPLLAKLYQTSFPGDTSHVITRRKKRRLKRDAVLVAAYATALAIGLNMIITYFKIARLSGSFEQIAGTQYSVPLAVGLVIYGILTPFTEELLFRGILYNRIRKYFPVPLAIFLGGLIFGCYHGNVVQILYAGIMGVVLSLLYEYYDRLLMAPVLFHCTANIIVYLLSKGSVFASKEAPVLYAIALLVVAAGITAWYIRNFRADHRK